MILAAGLSPALQQIVLLDRLQVGANYTLSKMWGNANGENVGSGPIRASMDTYPEYRQESWNYPMGYNPGDQRHKLRAMRPMRPLQLRSLKG